MNFWEPGLAETLYTIAMFLFIAIVMAPLLNWASTDDTRTVDDDTTDMENNR